MAERCGCIFCAEILYRGMTRRPFSSSILLWIEDFDFSGGRSDFDASCLDVRFSGASGLHVVFSGCAGRPKSC
jgi:hypothetical protein